MRCSVYKYINKVYYILYTIYSCYINNENIYNIYLVTTLILTKNIKSIISFLFLYDYKLTHITYIYNINKKIIHIFYIYLLYKSKKQTITTHVSKYNNEGNRIIKMCVSKL